jgi:hypothetical protein
MTGPEAELKGCYLKKQSQFSIGQYDAKSVFSMIYVSFDG